MHRASVPVHDALMMFQRDAELILAARQQAIALHGERDIREAGDQIEICAQEIFRKRFQHTSIITRGHLLDRYWKLSPQLDIIFCDPKMFPIWNETNSGSHHVMYDSVHAIGEVKSSYSKQSHSNTIHGYCDVIKRIKNEMNRENSNFSDRIGISAGGGISITSPDYSSYRNSLFCFELIVSSNDFDESHINLLFEQSNPRDLPNVVCMLDRGVIVQSMLKKNIDTEQYVVNRLNSIPELDVDIYKSTWESRISPDLNSAYSWIILKPKDAATRPGVCLLILHSILVEHLRRNILKADRPDLLSLIPAWDAKEVSPIFDIFPK